MVLHNRPAVTSYASLRLGGLLLSNFAAIYSAYLPFGVSQAGGFLMTNEEKRYVVERLGGCWHEVTQDPNHEREMGVCIKCGTECDWDWLTPDSDTRVAKSNIDLTTWEGFGWVINGLQEQGLWERFCGEHDYSVSVVVSCPALISAELINPPRLAEAVLAWLKENE
jgi:hypothetical protein